MTAGERQAAMWEVVTAGVEPQGAGLSRSSPGEGDGRVAGSRPRAWFLLGSSKQDVASFPALAASKNEVDRLILRAVQFWKMGLPPLATKALTVAP